MHVARLPALGLLAQDLKTSNGTKWRLYCTSLVTHIYAVERRSSRIVMNSETVKTNVCTVRAASAWPYGIVLTCIRRPSCSKDVEAGLPSLGLWCSIDTENANRLEAEDV